VLIKVKNIKFPVDGFLDLNNLDFLKNVQSNKMKNKLINMNCLERLENKKSFNIEKSFLAVGIKLILLRHQIVFKKLKQDKTFQLDIMIQLKQI
jgi:hypothetical protein